MIPCFLAKLILDAVILILVLDPRCGNALMNGGLGAILSKKPSSSVVGKEIMRTPLHEGDETEKEQRNLENAAS
jgi:hypothetical protein